MDYLEYYAPFIRFTAKKLSKNKDDALDLMQEGFIKLIKLNELAVQKGELLISECWQSVTLVSIKNSMLDILRRARRRQNTYNEYCTIRELGESTKFSLDSAYIKEHLQILVSNLSHDERRILKELLHPSEELESYRASYKALANIWKLPKAKPNNYILEPYLHGFFNMDRASFVASLNHISSIHIEALTNSQN